MDTRQVFEEVLAKHNLNWCRSCEAGRGHKRGFILNKDKSTVHYDSEIKTRSTLHGGLHEVGHCVNNEAGLRSYQVEALAERFASDTMRQYGISVPRKSVALGVAYVARKKRHGDRIKQALKA